MRKNTGGKHPRLWSVVSPRLLASLHELLFVRKSDRKGPIRKREKFSPDSNTFDSFLWGLAVFLEMKLWGLEILTVFAAKFAWVRYMLIESSGWGFGEVFVIFYSNNCISFQ